MRKDFLFGVVVLMAMGGNPIFALDIDNPEVVDAFERGLSIGVEAVEREFKIQGTKNEVVPTNNYLVVLDTDNLATKKTLLLKDFGFQLGLTAVQFTNGMLYFKSFEHEADANELVKLLNDKYLKGYKKQAYVYKKKGGESFYKAPFAFKKLFDEMEKEIKGNVPVVVLTQREAAELGLQLPAQTILPKPQPLPLIEHKSDVNVTSTKPTSEIKPQKADKVSPSKKQEIKYTFKLKGGKAQTYIKEGKGFKQSKVLQSTKTYSSGAEIIKQDGAEYIKVLNQNLYFDIFDVDYTKVEAKKSER